MVFLIITCFMATFDALKADDVISYRAYLSESDHFSSKGERLTSAAAIIRQDRANFHKLGRGDSADESDGYFSKASNREILEQMLKRGTTTRSVSNTIVNGTPYVEVTIYVSDSGSDYICVTVVN